eukprot:134552_1
MFIESALEETKFNTVFVHCREGRSRSVSFLCAYLMWKEGISFYAALSDVRSKRYIVLPNNKFYHELELFDKDLIIDRRSKATPRSKKYGVPSMFRLQKIQNGQFDFDAMNKQFDFPNNNSSDEQKLDVLQFDSTPISGTPQSIYTPTSGYGTPGHHHGGGRHSRQRSSSVTQIDHTQFTHHFSSNSNRYSYKDLSPIQGSPNTKKEKARYEDANKSPYADIFDDADIYGDANGNKKKKKKSNKSNTSSSKKKSN